MISVEKMLTRYRGFENVRENFYLWTILYGPYIVGSGLEWSVEVVKLKISFKVTIMVVAFCFLFYASSYSI